MESTRCCVVGGGPAGLLLALLLARRGIAVTLLEAARDFDRDFRGDTVHPATLELLDQIGLADAALALPHGKVERMALHSEGRSWHMADFRHLRTRFPYIAIIPQHLFLDFLAEQADALPTFTRIMGAAVSEVLRDGDRVVGVRYRRDGEQHELRADLVVGADGRFSRLRRAVDSEVDGTSPPMDVAWVRLPLGGEDAPGFHVGRGRLLVHFRRTDAIQLGYVFAKGGFGDLKARGIEAFRQSIVDLVPAWADKVDAIESFEDVHLLVVKSDCLAHWHRPGLLLIGDAAHAMSPVGGVGINYAIGDAVEAVNVLAPLLERTDAVPETALAEVQRRRHRWIRIAQRMQANMQRLLVERALEDGPFRLGWPLRLIFATPGLRALPPRMIAFGPHPVRLEVV